MKKNAQNANVEDTDDVEEMLDDIYMETFPDANMGESSILWIQQAMITMQDPLTNCGKMSNVNFIQVVRSSLSSLS